MSARYPRTKFFKPSILSGFGEVGIIPCPAGQHNVCLYPGPGAMTTPDMCHCVADKAPIQQATQDASTNVQNHWGLYIGVAVAAFIVYKVATR